MQSLLDNAALHHPSSLRKLLNHGHEIALLIRRFYLKLKIFMTTFEDFCLDSQKGRASPGLLLAPIVDVCVLYKV